MVPLLKTDPNVPMKMLHTKNWTTHEDFLTVQTKNLFFIFLVDNFRKIIHPKP